MWSWRALLVVVAMAATTLVFPAAAGAVGTTRVIVDVRPGSAESTFNPTTPAAVPVAVVTTAAFDAAAVDRSTACFGDAENARQRDCTPKHPGGVLEDVDGDGDRDLLLHFHANETGVDLGDTSACLEARTTGGGTVWGCDALHVIHGSPESTPPDLVVSVSPLTAVVEPRDAVGWTAMVLNEGPGAVTVAPGTALVRLVLPSSVSGGTVTAPTGWSCPMTSASEAVCTNVDPQTIDAGTARTFAVAAVAPAAPGPLTLDAIADPNGVVAEANETDNAAAGTVLVRAANLVVTLDVSQNVSNGGDVVTWTANVQNAGPGSIVLRENTRLLRFDVASALAAVSAAGPAGWSCTVVGSEASCTTAAASTVAAGETLAFRLEGTVPTVPGEISVGATADPDALVTETDEADNTATAVSVVQAPNLVTAVDATPDAPAPGDVVQWTVTVRNAGPGSLRLSAGTTLVGIDPPAGLAAAAITAPGGYTCTSDASGSYACSPEAVDVLAAGDTRVFVLEGTPSGSNNVLSATADPGSVVHEAVESDNTASDAVTVSRPDLSVSVVPSPAEADARSSVSWAIRMRNDGPRTAVLPTDTPVLQIQLPAGLANVFLTSAGGHTCYLAATNLVECALTAPLTLAPGEHRDYTLGALAPTEPGGATATVTVDPTNALTEEDEGDNIASGTVLVRAPDLSVAVVPSHSELDPRQSTTWAITITNDGPGAAYIPNETVLFQIQLPAGLANVFLTSPGGHTCYLAATNLVECATTLTESLAAGASRSYTLGALAPSTPGAISVAVEVDPEGRITEVDETDNTAFATGTVLASDLRSTITPSTTLVDVRQSLTWAIQIVNDGPGAAYIPNGTVLFQIQLPAGLANVFLTSPGGHTCYLAATNLVECAVTSNQTMAAGTARSYTLGALAPAEPGDYTTTITLDTGTAIAEIDETNNAASAVVTVQPPDLSVSVVASADPIGTREATTWPITIANDGPGAMQLASGRPFFQIQLPSGLANVFLTSPGGFTCYLAATNLVECATTSTLNVASGDSLAFTLGALAPSTPGTMTVTVTVDHGGHVTEADESDNVGSATTTVV